MSLSRKEAESLRQQLESKIFLAYQLSEDFKKYEDDYKVKKNDLAAEISQLAIQLGIENESIEFEFEPNKKRNFGLREDQYFTVNCKRIKPTSIKYDDEALFDRLKKNSADDGYKSMFSTYYSIENMSGLTKLLKEYGVPAREFKKFIKVSHKLLTDKLNSLYDIGAIKLEDIKGCFQVIKKSEYWKISAKASE